MPESHVLSALVKKRSELLGLVDYHRKIIDDIHEQLSHINASIKIFNPEFDLREVKGKKYTPSCKYFKRGERNRLILEMLRESDKLLTVLEITNNIKQSKQIEQDITITIRSALNKLQKKGLVEQVQIDAGVFGWQIVGSEKKQFKLL